MRSEIGKIKKWSLQTACHRGDIFLQQQKEANHSYLSDVISGKTIVCQ